MRRPVAVVRARPKSKIFSVQSDLTTILLGLRSYREIHTKIEFLRIKFCQQMQWHSERLNLFRWVWWFLWCVRTYRKIVWLWLLNRNPNSTDAQTGRVEFMRNLAMRVAWGSQCLLTRGPAKATDLPHVGVGPPTLPLNYIFYIFYLISKLTSYDVQPLQYPERYW